MGVARARAHERAPRCSCSAGRTEYGTGECEPRMYAQECEDCSFESRPVIGVEEEHCERVAKHSVHLDASDDVRWEDKG
jgi:hypothetical protein